MNDDHTYDGSNYADAECYMEDAHSLDFDGDRPRALIAMAFAQVKATLAIADALADLKPEPVTVTHPWSNPLTVTHPWPPWPSTLPDVDAADRYAANEAKQREGQLEDAWRSRDWETVERLQDEAERREAAEPDPLDEDDHRDRVDADRRRRIVRHGQGHWHTPATSGTWCDADCTDMSLRHWARTFGPLAFAPEPPPDAARDDLTASDGESGAEEGGDAADAPEALLCPECGHGIDDHGWDEDYALIHCLTCYGPNECRQAPSDIARHLIASAVKAEREAGTDG